MKQNKGFTLIELLAVIVILAIIALIATPLILGVIDTAKKGAAKASAYNYADSVTNQLAIDMLDPTKTVSLTTVYTATDASIKGKRPTSVTLNISEGVITGGYITVDGYKAVFGTNGEITSIDKA